MTNVSATKPDENDLKLPSQPTSNQTSAGASVKVSPRKGTKKKLLVESGTAGLFKIRYEGGGQLPDALTGSFTGAHLAEEAIEKHKAR